MVASIAICFVGSWLGIWLSFLFNFSTGPTIILVVAIFYGISLLLGKK
ncbi:MAG: metal ABC transporter permease [Thermoguttaceae bacterium]|nr:metal ABC transporter permease [Thermoguttaceae bacterium]